jgi:hypothetical protein
VPTYTGRWESNAYIDTPTSDESIIYWHQAMRELIIRTHPLRSTVSGTGVNTFDDLHQDGVEAVITALNEFDPAKWDCHLSAFLYVRIPQRLMDMHRTDRRARVVTAIAREVADGRTIPLKELVAHVEDSGKWQPWLGRCDTDKLLRSQLVCDASNEQNHLRLNAPSTMDARIPNIDIKMPLPLSVEDIVMPAEPPEKLSHLTGLDRETLLTSKENRPLLTEFLNFERDVPQVNETVNWSTVNRYAMAFAKSRHKFEETQKAWVGVSISTCEDCGLVWPVRTGVTTCKRAECLWGYRTVPAGFTQEYWADVRDELES